MNIVEPGTGINYIKFGMIVSDIISILGRPLSEMLIDEEGDHQLEYPKLGINFLSFTREYEFRLSLIEVNLKQPVKMWGNIFDSQTTVEDIKNAVSEKQLRYEFFPDEIEVRLTVPGLGIDFYFEDCLSEIGFSVPFDSNDECIWP